MYKNGIPKTYESARYYPDNVPRFNTRKWVEVHDQSGERYNIIKQIRFKISMLRSDICGYADAYIIVKETIPFEGANNEDKHDRSLILHLFVV